MNKYEGQRQWVVVARLGNDISARSAAARLSALDKAERDNLDIDVRVEEYDWVPENVSGSNGRTAK